MDRFLIVIGTVVEMWVNSLENMVEQEVINEDDINAISFLLELEFYIKFKNDQDYLNMNFSLNNIQKIGINLLNSIDQQERQKFTCFESTLSEVTNFFETIPNTSQITN